MWKFGFRQSEGGPTISNQVEKIRPLGSHRQRVRYKSRSGEEDRTKLKALKPTSAQQGTILRNQGQVGRERERETGRKTDGRAIIRHHCVREIPGWVEMVPTSRPDLSRIWPLSLYHKAQIKQLQNTPIIQSSLTTGKATEGTRKMRSRSGKKIPPTGFLAITLYHGDL